MFDDGDNAETRLIEVMLPVLTWFRLDRFTKCEDGWTFEEILLAWLEEWEARERDADRAALQNLPPGGG